MIYNLTSPTDYIYICQVTRLLHFAGWKNIETETETNIPVATMTYSFRRNFHNETEITTAAKTFNTSSEVLIDMGFPLKFEGDTALAEVNLYKFVFVTAASSNHFHECMDAVATVQQHFPNNAIYYYDLDENLPDNTTNKVGIYAVYMFSMKCGFSSKQSIDPFVSSNTK